MENENIVKKVPLKCTITFLLKCVMDIEKGNDKYKNIECSDEDGVVIPYELMLEIVKKYGDQEIIDEVEHKIKKMKQWFSRFN